MKTPKTAQKSKKHRAVRATSGKAESVTEAPFSAKQKEAIFKRDDYRCVACGSSAGLQACHIVPFGQGGKASIDNGYTLCSQHNPSKKSHSQTESDKSMFVRLLEMAEKQNDAHHAAFYRKILEIYDQYDVNGCIRTTL